MKDEFVTVKTFNFAAEVPIIQSYMEMLGIPIYLKNLIANQATYMIGDIEMQVAAEDYERAKNALIEGGFASETDFID
ncbi:MAG: hypothetical protein VB024_00040 [Dysgonamonadaceae bacterium]|nr:hypothetical protein [Dysgonamonadaceae bacterium]